MFDAEAFAKIELTVWPSYALGGGIGTNAAAVHLSRGDVNWFSNFFATNEQDYLRAGGNGAAMRIQPHVWTHDATQTSAIVLDVLRNALITHGHPHGFCGAVFHALTLNAARTTGGAPGLNDWHDALDQLAGLPQLLEGDRQLAEFWQPAWEQKAGTSLKEAIAVCGDEARRDLDLSRHLVESSDPNTYSKVLSTIGCLDRIFRGSGIKTALAAAMLSWLYRGSDPEAPLRAASNALGSDTDTIATMAGAIIGSYAAREPEWPLQDREYIAKEATRLARFASGTPQDSFAYPDVARWAPPDSHGGAIGRYGRGHAIVGLGATLPISDAYSSGDAVWQWMQLPFGQTILVKRRKSPRFKVRPDQLPGSTA
jgi:ADP-ribosylglycohydrolase